MVALPGEDKARTIRALTDVQRRLREVPRTLVDRLPKIAWWRSQSSPAGIDVPATIVVLAAGLGYGRVVACWSKLNDRRSVVSAVPMVVVIWSSLAASALLGRSRVFTGVASRHLCRSEQWRGYRLSATG